MNQNKYSHLDDDQLLKFQEEQEIQKLLRKSKKEFDKNYISKHVKGLLN